MTQFTQPLSFFLIPFDYVRRGGNAFYMMTDRASRSFSFWSKGMTFTAERPKLILHLVES